MEIVLVRAQVVRKVRYALGEYRHLDLRRPRVALVRPMLLDDLLLAFYNSQLLPSPLSSLLCSLLCSDLTLFNPLCYHTYLMPSPHRRGRFTRCLPSTCGPPRRRARSAL